MLASPALFFFGTPNPFQNLAPLHARNGGANRPKQPSCLVPIINRTIRQVQGYCVVLERLEQRVVNEIIRADDAREFPANDSINRRVFQPLQQLLHFGSAKNSRTAHIHKLNACNYR